MEKKKFDRLAAAVSPTDIVDTTQRETAPKPLIPPTWSYWPGERVVDVFQAVALSLDIDPDCLEFTQFGQIRYLRDPETRDEFVKRVKLIAMVPPHAAMLPLSQFAMKLGTLKMPAEMAAHSFSTTMPATIETGTSEAKELAEAKGRLSALVVALDDEAPIAGTNSTVSKETIDPIPRYITTTELAACFGGYMGVEDPKKVISGYPDWATKFNACITRGRAGAVTKNHPDISEWNPVLFAENLLKKRPIPQLPGLGKLRQSHLDTVFNMPTLAAWKPFWMKQKPQ